MKDNKQKIAASILLIFSIIIFIIFKFLYSKYPEITYLKLIISIAEGAMIGGLADWFAVVALFRHPLNIPFPHTAILPNKKADLGDRLGTFLENNFLQYEIIYSRLREIKLIKSILISKLSKKKQSNVTNINNNNNVKLSSIANDLVILLLKKQTNIDFLSQRLLKLTKAYTSNKRIAPVLGKIINKSIKLGIYEKTSTQMIKLIDKSLTSLLPSMEEKFNEILPDFLKIFREPIFKVIMVKIYQLLSEIQKDTDHPARKNIEQELLKLAIELEHNPDKEDQIKNFINNFLNDSKVEGELKNLLKSIKGSALKASNLTINKNKINSQDTSAIISEKNLKDTDVFKTELIKFLNDFSTLFLKDKTLVQYLDKKCCNILANIISSQKQKVSYFISSEIKNWDNNKVTKIIESKIGNDLQWIRINGTIIGGLAGGMIYLTGSLF